MARHPARFTEALLPVLRDALRSTVGSGATVLDPFAGTGRIHELHPEFATFGVELEPEWARLHPRTIVGNALHLPWPDALFDAICTSPTYGNRMADHHEAKDDSKRMTYRHSLGRKLSDDNSGQLQWGPAYREFHEAAWAEAYRVLKPGGAFIVNISNHVRAGKVIDVTGWHVECLQTMCVLRGHVRVPTPRMRFGANGQARVDSESVLVFQKPNPTESRDAA